MQWEAAFRSRGGCSSSRWSSEGGGRHGLPGSAFPSGVVQGPDWGTQPHLQVRVVPGTTATSSPSTLEQEAGGGFAEKS